MSKDRHVGDGVGNDEDFGLSGVEKSSKLSSRDEHRKKSDRDRDHRSRDREWSKISTDDYYRDNWDKKTLKRGKDAFHDADDQLIRMHQVDYICRPWKLGIAF